MFIEVTRLLILILIDIFNLNQLWKENLDRRILHHFLNCRYNIEKTPFIYLFKKLINVFETSDFSLNIENYIVKFDNIEGNGINTYSKYVSNLTGGLYSKRSTLYYKDFPEDLRNKCLQIGNNVKRKIEYHIDKKLYWGESDFKVVLLRYEGESASFAWHYDTEPENCFRTLTLIKGKGVIPPFCYKDINNDTQKLHLSIGDTIFIKGTQTYHMVENSDDPNTVRWINIY